MPTPSTKRPVAVFAINGLIVAGAERLYIDLFRQGFPGYELHLVTFFQFPKKREWYEEVPSGVVVHKFNFKGFKDIKEWFAMWRTLRTIRPNVIVSSLYFSNTIMRILGWGLRIPVITIEHNTYVEKTSNQQRLDRWLADTTYKIVAVSKSVLEFTAAQEHIPKEKFLLIHNGIDQKQVAAAARAADPFETRAALGLQPADTLIIAVGRLTAQKNHRMLIEGFALFHKAHPGYVLAIAGEGSLKQNLLDLVTELHATSYIRLLGARPDVPALHAASTFYVSTSHIEGFPLAHIEALCCGLPVLTTKTAGSDEMIQEGINGLFLDASTPEKVAAGCEQMVQTKWGSRESIATSVSQFTIESTAAAYRKLVAEAITR